MKFTAEEFYPTPQSLLDKMTQGLNWSKLNTVLEPSAGKGDIVSYITEHNGRKGWWGELDIDCIEKDDDLQSALKGKGYKVVHDDFLTYNTFKKYDLIIMNPPFSTGATHLLKALELQENGGAVICILNAETLRNPYSNERQTLVNKLKEYNAEITYLKEEFVSSERPTNVEIALIRVTIPEKEYESHIFESLKRKSYGENTNQDITDLAPGDFVEAIVKMYEIEVEAGVRLIQEYNGMRPHILDSLTDKAYTKPILELTVMGKELSVNRYVREVRKKYWNALFRNPKFTGKMTSNLQEQYSAKVKELAHYDFSLYNIRCIQIEMSQHLVKGIEDCIIELFDKLSFQHSYYGETSNNIHYYNGWKTNKAWIINKKVILPYMSAWSTYFPTYDPTDYGLMLKLMDIEKALNYLDGGITDALDMQHALSVAKENEQTKKIELKYFYVTFYKKGTCHIEFKDEELLKKLNIFGSQQKGWLPQGYGTRTYKEMDSEEKAVIDSFEGSSEYEKTLQNRDYYIYNPKSSMPALEMTA